MRFLLWWLGQSLDDRGRDADHTRIRRSHLNGAERGDGEGKQRRCGNELPFHGWVSCRKLCAGKCAWIRYGDKDATGQYTVPPYGIIFEMDRLAAIQVFAQ